MFNSFLSSLQYTDVVLALKQSQLNETEHNKINSDTYNNERILLKKKN